MFFTPEIVRLVEECNSGRSRRRTIKRPRSPRPAGQQLDPAVKKQMAQLTRRLGTSSPELRSWMVDEIRQKFTLPQIAMLVDSVLKAVLQTPPPVHFEGLVNTLIGLGARSLYAIHLTLVTTKSVRRQVALARVLECMTPMLSDTQRTELALHLQVAIVKWADPNAIEALVRVMAAVAIRHESEFAVCLFE